MALFGITRKTLLDLSLDEQKLTALADLLWLWWCRQSAGDAASGSVVAEAIVFCIARPHIAALQASIAAATATPLNFDTTDPDELRIVGPATTGEAAPDLSAWMAVLATPGVDEVCVRLRISFEGTVSSPNGRALNGRATFVLVGKTQEETLQVKALWRLGRDEAMEAVYRLAAWEHEHQLVEAAELFNSHRIQDPHEAARFAWRLLGKAGPKLFAADQVDRQAIRVTRSVAEMPDERGVVVFFRRACIPIALGLLLTAVAIYTPGLRAFRGILLIVAAFAFLTGGSRLIWKMVRITLYRIKMRSGLNKLYSRDSTYELADLSADLDPTLRKCSIEIQSLPAMHLCDVSISTANGTFDANRIFVKGDTTIFLGMLRKSGAHLFFPSKPIMLMSTRFLQGGKHVTQNRPRARRLIEPLATLRCAPEESSPSETFNIHRAQVTRRIVNGDHVKSPASTPAAQIEQMLSDRELSKAAWFRSPYSWSDAVHDAFKITRREFLRD